MYKIAKAAIWSLRRNARFNEFWLRRREGLRFAPYLLANAITSFGTVPRVCSSCAYRGRFRAAGSPPTWDARCPNCGSHPRQRLMALYLQRNPDLGCGRTVHFAPEPSIARQLTARATAYTTADLFQPGVDRRLDLQNLDLADDSIDLFICSHLLEHVPDDRQALAELFRCTAPGGTVLIMVPIVESWAVTYENADITDDHGRTLHFGQNDHVRYYGADLRKRIADAGFELTEFTASPDECILYSLGRGETIFAARKAV